MATRSISDRYQESSRNVYLSPIDNKVYISNHGAKGGDFFGEVEFGGNYGWKIIGWGGNELHRYKNWRW